MTNFYQRINERNVVLTSKGTFQERMAAIGDSLLHKWVVADLAELTDSAIWSVAYSWAKGNSLPPLCKQRIIANYFRCEVDELFPEGK